MNSDILKNGDNVLIKLPSGTFRLVTVKSDCNMQVNLGKFGSFMADDIIGRFYNQPLEIFDTMSIRTTTNIDFLADFNVDPMEITEATNQGITDTAFIQKLSQSEIEELKSDGQSGQLDTMDIIQRLVTNNENYNEKTEFSKAKYIKRKVEK